MALDPNYHYLVERKYPIRRLLGEARSAADKHDLEESYTRHMLEGKTADWVLRQRQYIGDRIKIAYWMVETISEKVPAIKEKSYMNCYEQAQNFTPIALKNLSKSHTIKPEEVEEIKKAIMWLDIFFTEIT